MDRITVYNHDKTEYVVLPRVTDIEAGAEEESKTITMASGKRVKDVLGYRSRVNASWDWIPAETVTGLLRLIRTGEFMWVEYPSPEGAASGYFEIEYPTLSVFTYRNGKAVWHKMSLSMKAQEVT